MKQFNSLRKGIFASVLAVLFIISMISCQNDTVQPTPENYSLAGTIKDGADMSVPSAVIQITTESPAKTAKLQGEIILATDTTDEDGNYSFDGLPMDFSKLNFKVRHPDFAEYKGNLGEMTKDKDKKHLPVRLLNDTNCKGRIEIFVKSKKDSSVVREAEVRLNRGKDIIRKTYSNTDGKVVFENVCPGTYWIRIARTGYKVKETDGLVIEGTSTIERLFYLEPVQVDTCCNGVISVVAKNGDNQEFLSGAVIKLFKDGKLLNSYTTEQNGTIVFRGLCVGNYAVSLFKQGFVSQEFSVSLTCNDTSNNERTMLRDSCCNGRVLITLKDTNGAPVPAVNIKLMKESNLLGTVKTNDLGQYLFTGMCAGIYRIIATREDLKTLEYSFTVLCNDSMALEKTIYPIPPDTCCKGEIKIYLVDDYTRVPLNGATIKIWKNGVLLGSKTVENGYVTFTGLCTGKYAFDMLKDGYVHKEFAIELPCNNKLELEKALVTETPKDTCCNGVIKVLVRDNTTKEYLNGATVKLYKNGALFKTATVSGGYAIFNELCKGTYGLDILKDLYTHQELQVELACNETKVVEKNLTKTNVDTCCKGNYTVYLQDSATGKAIPEATVYLWKGSTKIRTATSDASGKVSFGELCEGQYSVSVSRTNYNGKEWSFTLTCNQKVTIEKSIVAKTTTDTCCTAILKVKVIEDSTEARIAEAKVIIYKGDKAIADPRTNVEGWAVVEKLCAPGTYKIVVSKDGYTSADLTVTFKECITSLQTIKLKKN